MPEIQKPSVPESPSSVQADGKALSKASRDAKRDESFIWPHGMNTPPADKQPRGRDPEGLRDA